MTDTQELPPSCGPAVGLSNEDLVQVALESYGRSFIYPDSEVNHNRWVECRAELLSRLARTPSTSPPQDGLIARQDIDKAKARFHIDGVGAVSKDAFGWYVRGILSLKRVVNAPAVAAGEQEDSRCVCSHRYEQHGPWDYGSRCHVCACPRYSRTPSVSEECLMADCQSPQEHFCFQHCLEVYGTELEGER